MSSTKFQPFFPGVHDANNQELSLYQLYVVASMGYNEITLYLYE